MYNVLIVEDEEIIRQGLKRMIENMGIEEIGSIFEAPDGQYALRFWQNFKPEIVLTDVRMSHMDGLELIASIRKYDSRTRFIIISGYGEFSYAQKAISHDVSEYLIKPVSREKLKESLKALIGKLKKWDPASGDSVHVPRKEAGFDNRAINTIISYIDDHYRNDICLNMAANLVSMNPNYFSMLFKKVTGMNFIKYLQHIRIGKAKELLSQPDMKIHEIPELVGFMNEKYFFKVFKEFEGITPSEFKKECLIAENH